MPQWCGVATRAVAEAEFGSGDLELGDRQPVLDDGELLLGNTDDDLSAGKHPHRRGAHGEKSAEGGEAAVHFHGRQSLAITVPV